MEKSEGAHSESATPAALVRAFWGHMASNEFSSIAPLVGDDLVVDWPQSNERIVGMADFVAINAEYPAHGRWRFSVRRLVADGDQVVTETAISDGVQSALAISFFTVADGRIRRIVEYWPEPYPAPSWRAHRVRSIR